MSDSQSNTSQSETVPIGAQSTATLPLKFVADYEILEEIGRGGMGVVYKARQQGLNRIVALKMILNADQSSPETRLRFEREAQAIARLDHPNIVQIYEITVDQGRPCFSMEYLTGGTLKQKLAQGELLFTQCARLIELLARAIHVAHIANVIHRDLKPDNVLIHADASPKITDFGLARQLDEAGQTQSGAIMGTPSYMAPEQASGKTANIGPGVDVYALGAVLYECLTGEPPFKSATMLDTIFQVVSQPVVPPSRLRQSVPRDLETICLKCLEKNPLQRYESAEALADDLRRFQAGEPIQARPVSSLEKFWRWTRRNPLVASLILAVFLTLSIGAVVASIFAVRADRKAEEALAQKTIATEKAASEQAQRQRAERLLYLAQIKQAHQQWHNGNSEAARDLLVNTTPEFRHWEYRYLWNLFHREAILKGHTEDVQSVAYSPDGVLLASASDDKTVRLWNPVTGKSIFTLRAHHTEVVSLAFSPDGQVLASLSKDGELIILQLSDRQILYRIRAHQKWSYALAISPDSQWIATTGDGGIVKILNLASGTERLKFKVQNQGIRCLVWSADGQQLFCEGSERANHVWDTTTGKPVTNSPFAHVHSSWLTLDPQGRYLIVSAGREITIYNYQTGKVERTLTGHLFGCRCVCSPDGRWLISGSWDKTVRIWELATGEPIATLQGHLGYSDDVAISPDGRTIASGGSNGNIRLWNITARKAGATLPTGYRIKGIHFLPGGRRMITLDGQGRIQSWDFAERRLLRTVDTKRALARYFALDPQGQEVAAVGYGGLLQVFDAHTLKEKYQVLADNEYLLTVSYTQNREIITVGKDKVIKFWHADTGEFLRSLTGHTADTYALHLSPDGRWLATGSYDKTCKIWDMQTNHCVRTLTVGDRVRAVKFTPDSQRLVVGTLSGGMKLYDRATGETLVTFQGHTSSVDSFDFTNDGRRLISGSVDRSMRLWDVKSGKEVLTFRNGWHAAYVVAFGPNDQILLSGHDDLRTRILDSSPMNPDKVTLTPDMSPLAYHEAQLRYAIEKEDNFAQAFHLQEILKLQPWRRELHLRRAFALRNLNRSQESLPHYLSAWMLNSAQPYWPRDDQARKRAEYAVRKQDWLKAAHAYTLVIHQSSSTLSDLQSLSLCQMRAGLKHEAADTISFLINHYGNTGDMTTLGRVVLYGRNVPTNSGSAKRLVQLGERYVAINKSASSLNRFGTILYRAGEYQRAIAVLREAIELHSKDGYVDSWLFLALSLHQAGQWDEAQQWWKKVQRWAKDRKHKSWQTELRWQLWLKEAEQVLDKAPPMPRA